MKALVAYKTKVVIDNGAFDPLEQEEVDSEVLEFDSPEFSEESLKAFENIIENGVRENFKATGRLDVIKVKILSVTPLHGE